MKDVNYSIIIPHFNIPDLLMRCLQSIPVREDIQVIVVDDCSPNASHYLQDYSELSRPYLEYYSTSHGGSAGRARNVGLDYAKGKWLIFLDADDLLTDDAEQILDATVNRTEDIIFYNSKCVLSDDLTQKSDRNFYDHFFAEFPSNHDEIPFRYRFHSLWGKVIRREMVLTNNIRFDETRYSNDVFFSCVSGHHARNITVIDRPLFIVTERRDSLASSQFSNKGISLEECLVRYNVALKIKLLLDKWGVKVFPFQLYEYCDKLRDNYIWAYAKMLAKLTFTHPSIASLLWRKEFHKLYHNLRQFMFMIIGFFPKLFFKMFKMSKGNVERHFSEKALKYVSEHELPLNDDYTPYEHQYSQYFKKWGLKVPMVVSEYCSRMSGIKSDTYLPRDLSFNYIYPYLVRYDFCPAYADKNIEARILNIKKVQEKVDVLIPHSIVYNMNGIFFNDEDEEISAEQAAEILVKFNQDSVIKPALGTFGGVGVVKLDHSSLDKQKYMKLFEEYKTDFVVQEIVKQHPALASFNESSVNTMRIVTYRKPNKERKVLYAIIRYGGKGEFRDNVCAGGGFSVINLDGTLKDRIIHIYKTTKLNKLPNTTINKIPYFDKVLEAALELHGQLPHFDIMGWDFALTPDGHPVLIEYNIRPGYGIQSGVGPMFSEEELDEIMPHVMNHRKTFVVKPYVHFNEKPNFDSFWDI